MRSLLFKLQAVFDLPKRLQVAIDQGALELAVNSYADAAPLLKQYGHKVGMCCWQAKVQPCTCQLQATNHYL